MKKQYQTTIKCTKCGHRCIADVDIDGMATVKAYQIVEEAIKKYKDEK